MPEIKVFNPSEAEKKEMFAEMGKSFRRQSKPAFKPVTYDPKIENIEYLFSEAWRKNKALNLMFAEYQNVSPNYFTNEKGGNLYEILSYYICENAIQQTIYYCNMPENTWQFCKWFHNVVSHKFLKEHLKEIPDFKQEKSMFEFVVNHKLIEKSYQLFLSLQ